MQAEAEPHAAAHVNTAASAVLAVAPAVAPAAALAVAPVVASAAALAVPPAVAPTVTLFVAPAVSLRQGALAKTRNG